MVLKRTPPPHPSWPLIVIGAAIAIALSMLG